MPEIQSLADAAIHIDVACGDTLNFALEQSGVPLIRSVTITNGSQAALQGAELEFQLEPDFGAAHRIALASIPAGTVATLSLPRYQPDAGRLRQIIEAERSFLHWRLCVGDKVLADGTAAIDVLAHNEWPGLRAPPQLLASFVTPNHPVIARLLLRVADRLGSDTGNRSINGYQDRSRKRALEQIAALYGAIQSLGLNYVGAPASFEMGGQKVRLCDTVLGERLANCLDLSLLFASCLEQMGISPLVVVIEGHAFVGAWLTDERFPEGLLEDASRLKTVRDLNDVVFLESTAVTAQPAIAFTAAVDAARDHLLDSKKFRFALDVNVVHRTGFRPLPLRIEQGPATPAPSEATAPAQDDEIARILAEAAAADIPVPRSTPPPADDVVARFGRWKERLLDLTLRSRLLNFRPSGTSSLQLVDADAARVAARLEEEGGSLELVPQAKRDVRDQRAQVDGDGGAGKAQRAADLVRGRAHTALEGEELWTRARKLDQAARTEQEEGGANVLFAALGSLRWRREDDDWRLAPLLLLPVTIAFDRGRRRVTLQRAQGEPHINETLVEMARRDHDVDFSPLTAFGQEQGFDVPVLLRLAREAIRGKAGWEVVDEVHLGLFSFTKFLMWKDLADNAEVLLRNPVVRHIAAARGSSLPASSKPLAPEAIDRDPSLVPCVVDADATQLAAISSALAGDSYVLQGPPGTGKSQTITNIIGAALCAGKTVLFVSEKMAALEVVYQRLADVGLGDFCLELHSHKSNKKQVLESLLRPLQSKSAPPLNFEARSKELAKQREQLNAYPRALHADRRFGKTFHEASGRLLELGDAPEVRCRFPNVQQFDADAVAALSTSVRDFSRAAAAVEPASAHPFAGSGQHDWSSTLQEELADALAETDASLQAANTGARALLTHLSLPAELATASVRSLAAAAEVAAAGRWPAAALMPDWPAASTRARAILQASREDWHRRQELGARWTAPFLDSTECLRRFQRWVPSSAPISFVMLIGARRQLRTLARGTLARNADLLKDLQLAERLRADSAGLDADWRWSDRLLEQTHGREPESLDRCERLLAAGDAVHAASRSLGAELQAAFSRMEGPQTGELAARARAAIDKLGVNESVVRAILQWSDWPATAGVEHREALHHLLETLRRSLPAFRNWCAYERQRRMIQQLGLETFADAHLSGAVGADKLEVAFERSLLSRFCSAVRDSEPVLRAFDGRSQHALVEDFRGKDREYLQLTRQHILGKLRAKVPAVSDATLETSEAGILVRQSKRKTGHMPIRKLIHSIPSLLPRLKPCMLMSPLSVAQYLPADARQFDLVVFDEASQIGTHDAIGAIARGKQVVIVGDSKQLPPTAFFSRNLDDETVVDENDVQELESVLDEAVAKQLPQLMLGWHYRSRHQSLIEFSNTHYYDGKLNVFPAAADREDSLGVSWHPVPEGRYYSGGARAHARTNPVEAKAVVDYLVSALKRFGPGERTFGVVTFNLPQCNLILDLLEEARARHPAIEPHFTGKEPVFVKNLENVQGDERDEILFSICYARDENDRLRMGFGPLSSAGGERRLNVAITRARAQVRVFSTLRPEEIDLRRSQAAGSRHLKEFLAYASASGATPQANSARQFESGFERRICEAVERAGLTVESQIGCGGYKLDLAVQHPKRPGSFALGIESDGKPYASGIIARDRDRLRAQVLKGLGWTLHRTWSSDWCFDPKAEEARLLAAIAAAVGDIPTQVLPQRAPQPEPELPQAEPALIQSIPVANPSAPYSVAVVANVSSDVQDLYSPRFTAYVRDCVLGIVAAEGPVHSDRIARRVLGSFGGTRLTPRVKERVGEAINGLVKEAGLKQRGEFIWPRNFDDAGWKVFRASLGGELRDLEEIPPEEIANAAAWVLSQSLSIDEAELVRETGRLLGVTRLTARMSEFLQTGINVLEQRRLCRLTNSRVHWLG